MEMTHAFEGFPSLHRYSKEKVVITEKIDGTNAQVFINDDSTVIRAGSRNRWITPQDDNFGFARYVDEHRDWMLKYLGPGRHFGEWYGRGIQRGYGLREKRFALFNAGRWTTQFDGMRAAGLAIIPRIETVPVIKIVNAGDHNPYDALRELKTTGSLAVPGFMDPEGIVCYHTLSKVSYKTTFEGDKHKWETTINVAMDNLIDQSRGQPEGH